MRQTVFASGLAGVILLSSLVLLRGQTLAPTPPRSGEEKKEPHTLRTSGSATIRVKPDAARVFFGVQTQAATIKDARVDNNTRIRKIMEALTALKIPDLKTKTSDVQVAIIHGRTDGHQLPPIVGYQISNTFTVLIQDEDPIKLGVLASRVLDTALENGANSVQQITFLRKEGLSELAGRKALTGAMEDALGNAKAMAAGARKDHIEVIAIEGQPIYHDRLYGSRNAMVQSANVALRTGGESDASLVVGDLEVTCQVNVTCTY